MDDGKLVDLCLSGDQAAIRAFVERFQGLVFTICLRRLKNRQDAEDITQQTLVRAIRHLNHWDSSRPIKPWILTIAINRCRTHMSRLGRQIRVVKPGIEFPMQENRLENLGLAEELQIALGKVREEYRTCFILFHQNDLSITDVAERMNCPEGTVKTWLHRARRELAEILVSRGVATKEGHEL